jgi:hypothetical protein
MKHFCPNDGWVAFRNSELISGNIAKKTIGDGSKTGLLYVLLRDCGAEEAAKFMDRFSKLCSRYFGMHRGFSIGISDVSPSAKLKKMKYDILSEVRLRFFFSLLLPRLSVHLGFLVFCVQHFTQGYMKVSVDKDTCLNQYISAYSSVIILAG